MEETRLEYSMFMPTTAILNTCAFNLPLQDRETTVRDRESSEESEFDRQIERSASASVYVVCYVQQFILAVGEGAECFLVG
jgi:hypothetical protein